MRSPGQMAYVSRSDMRSACAYGSVTVQGGMRHGARSTCGTGSLRRAPGRASVSADAADNVG
jgi:hypothetical protein